MPGKRLIATLLPQSEAEALRDLAKRQERTVSGLLRLLIRRELNDSGVLVGDAGKEPAVHV